MLALISTLIIQTYFPLEEGLTWEYVVTVDLSAIQAEQTIKTLEPVLIDNKKVVPMQVWMNGKPDNVAYYQESDGFVKLVAQSSKELLPQPVPVLPVTPKKGQKWEFTGQAVILGGAAASSSKSTIIGFDKSEVLGKLTEVLKVETRSKIGSGPTAMEIKTTDLYSAGIGLVHRRQDILGKKPGGATMVLKSFHRTERL